MKKRSKPPAPKAKREPRGEPRWWVVDARAILARTHTKPEARAAMHEHRAARKKNKREVQVVRAGSVKRGEPRRLETELPAPTVEQARRVEEPFAEVARRTVTGQRLESGYAFVAKGDIAVHSQSGRANAIRNDDWEHEVITPRGDEYPIGQVRIDGTMHKVWWSPELQANVAQILYESKR